jgi:hypothetical protein
VFGKGLALALSLFFILAFILTLLYLTHNNWHF